MIHQFSCIHPDARLGEGVEIGPFVTIGENVEIGDGTRIMSNATVLPGSRIGKGCTIFPGAVVGAVPQDLKFRGEDTLAVIGDGTVLRECVTVHRGTASKGITSVGSNCLIMAYCHVAHDCAVGNGVIMSNATQLAGEVHVDDCAVVGGGTLIHQFCHIGPYVMIQGGALINKDIPPFVKAAREPISFTGINSVGLRRHNFTDQQIEEIQQIYRIIYYSGLNFTDAACKVEDEMPDTPIRAQILDFIRQSPRGILRGNV